MIAPARRGRLAPQASQGTIKLSSESIFTALTLWEWRDRQASAIHDQLTGAYPELERLIDAHVSDASLLRIAGPGARLGSRLQAIIRDWAEEQKRIALERAEASLDASLAEIQVHLGSDLARLTNGALPGAVAGGALIAAAAAVLPAAVSLATGTATIAVFFSTATFSAPVLLAGGAAAGALALTGSTLLKSVPDRLREHTRRQAQAQARVLVFGAKDIPGEPSVLNDIQALALRSAAARLGGTA